MKSRFQSGASAVQEISGTLDSPYLTSDECSAYLRFPSIRAFYKFIESPRGQAFPRLYRGRVLLFDKRLVDLWLRESRSMQRVAVRRVHAASIRKVGNEEKSRNLDGENC